MKKILLFVTAILVATSVLAFGGGGKSRKSSVYRGTGVDSIGVHFNGKGNDSGDSGEICASGVTKDRFGHCNICANGNVYLSYNDDPCGTETSFDGCKSNADCDKGEYCHLNNTDLICYYPIGGTCEKIGAGTPATIAGLGNVLKSNEYMTWWAAENWCKAQGMRLVTIEEMGCHKSGTTISVTEYSGYDGGCCAEGKSCSWDGNWFNNDNKDRYSTVLYDLEQAYRDSQYLWMISDYSSNGSCNAFYVPLYNGYVSYNPRYASVHYALCVEQ